MSLSQTLVSTSCFSKPSLAVVACRSWQALFSSTSLPAGMNGTTKGTMMSSNQKASSSVMMKLPAARGPTVSCSRRSSSHVAHVATPPHHAPKEVLPTDESLPPPSPNNLTQLFEQEGQSPWIDNLSRLWLSSGHLEEMRQRGVRGLTSNPTIFQKAVDSTDAYDNQFRELLLGSGGSPSATDASNTSSHSDNAAAVEAAMWGLMLSDIQQAADVMRPLYNESNGGDGFVSLEVAPALALDTRGTIVMARDLFRQAARPNLMIKIPGTKAGLPAIRQMISEGVNVNVTLIFSLSRYEQVIDAYLQGLEARLQNVSSDCKPSAVDSPLAPLSGVASVASFFVSRVDSAVDAQLTAIGSDKAKGLLGKAAISQAVLAYRLFEEKFSGPRWEALAKFGAKVQRPLWASTGVKNPNYSNTLYVDSLIGPNSVNTLPDATVVAFASHGKVKRTIDVDVNGARKVMKNLEELGIDMEKIAEDLEKDGVQKFASSFDGLLASLMKKATVL